MLNLKDALDLFYENRQTYCSDVTVKNYKNTLRYFSSYIVQALDEESAYDLNVKDITLHHLNTYSIMLKSKLKNTDGPVASCDLISSRTRKDYLKDVVTFFNFLADFEYIEYNPCDRLKLPRVETQPVEVLTVDEVKKIDSCFNCDKARGARNLAIIHLLLDMGLRSGEVQRLKFKDVHFDENYIIIRNSKCGKGRMLPLVSVARDYLINYLTFKKFELDADDYVFGDDSGKAFTDNAMKCMFQRLKNKSGVKRVYPHLLRHTFATSFILGGGSVEVLRIYMGHSSIETTQKYLHLANNMRFLENVYPLDECFLKKFY